MKTNNSETSKGSALVVVLGILSVMMLMAVAFSMFTRAERSGTTNLKNSFVARQSLQTALGKAIEAIDLSFDNPTNSWAVPVWREPFISSSSVTSNDFFFSRRLGTGEHADAKILNKELASFLTPAQLALVRSADVQWAPIYASVSAKDTKNQGGGVYGLEGYPNDSLVGRYAFVVLDTTGLLDRNKAGLDQNANVRKETCGEDPSAFILPSKNMEKDGLEISLQNPARFLTGRAKAGTFFSTADMIRYTAEKENVGLGIEEGKYPSISVLYPGKQNRLGNSSKGDQDNGPWFPADLFSGVTTSLDELTPEGHPKIALPDQDAVETWNTTEVRNFAKRSLAAMVRVFARSRSENVDSDKARSAAEDARNTYEPPYRFFVKKRDASNSVSRARLATISLLDSLDEDTVSGKWGTFNAWQNLGNIQDLPLQLKDSKNPALLSDSFTCPDSVANNPLNFPITEDSAALSMTWAYLQKGNDDPKFYVTQGNTETTKLRNGMAGTEWKEGDPDDPAICKKVFREVEFVAHIGAAARCFLADPRTLPRMKLDVQYDVLFGRPKTPSISKLESDNYEIVEYLNRGAGTVRDPYQISWEYWGNGEWQALDSEPNYIHRTFSVDSGAWSMNTKGFGDEDTIRFRVRSYAKKWPVVDEEAPNGHRGTWEFYEQTNLEESPSDFNRTDIYFPVRMSTKLSSSAGDIQQVPAPALMPGRESDSEYHTYWIRMDMGVAHLSGTETSVENPNGSKGDLAPGWAMCAAPMFGFDTTSLWTDNDSGQASYPDGMLVWMNDFVARTTGEDWMTDLVAYMDMNGLNEIDGMRINAGRSQTIFNYLQRTLLFSENYSRMPYSQWMMHLWNAYPDMAHLLVRNDQSTAVGRQSASSGAYFGTLEMMNRSMPNGAFLSVGDLGGVTCGPYETLSLFHTYRWAEEAGGLRGDFHRVLDYFTLTEPRSPKTKNIQLDSTTSDPKGDNALYSAIHNGRVNLNAPQLVRYSDVAPPRAVADGPLNPFPIATVFNGAAYVCDQGTRTNTLSETKAYEIARDLLDAFEASEDIEEVESKRFKTSRRIVSRLSDLGIASDFDDSGKQRNPILEHIMEEGTMQSDAERESIFRSVANGFTTRGQSYLILLRADAYTPNYGFDDSTADGTTLATTRAIVEVFRDPVPARSVEGKLVEDKDGPVAYHNWLIRSFRVF